MNLNHEGGSQSSFEISMDLSHNSGNQYRPTFKFSCSCPSERLYHILMYKWQWYFPWSRSRDLIDHLPFQVPSYHLILEASLVCWVVWLLIRRVSHRNRRLKAEKLTKEEEEELIAEWKPEPLVPEVDPNHPALHVPIMDGKVSKHCENDPRLRTLILVVHRVI